jgi:hypothetical protein
MDPCTPFEERAAILEYLAGYPRTVAERMAREQLDRAARGGDQLSLIDPRTASSFAKPGSRSG